jgi:ankyrin repeat protein
MFHLGKHSKRITLYFFIIIFLSTGYAGGAPLHEAAKNGDMDHIIRLLEDGTPIDVIDENSNTPLYIAVGEGHKEVAELFIIKGANVNAVCWRGYTPLHWSVAALGGEKELAELLIAKGAIIDAVDRKGKTPLAHAAYSGYKELAELLISKGANVNAIDNKGRTPLDWANYSHHKDLVELLIRHGGETRTPWSGSSIGKWL